MPVFFTHEKNRVGVRGGVQVAARSNRRCVCMRSQLPVKSWSCDRCLVFIPLQLWRKTAHRPPTSLDYLGSEWVCRKKRTPSSESRIGSGWEENDEKNSAFLLLQLLSQNVFNLNYQAAFHIL